MAGLQLSDFLLIQLVTGVDPVAFTCDRVEVVDFAALRSVRFPGFWKSCLEPFADKESKPKSCGSCRPRNSAYSRSSSWVGS